MEVRSKNLSCMEVEFSDKELKFIYDAALMQDISPEKVVIAAIRVYQLYLYGDLIRKREDNVVGCGDLE
jgi:hypothetical protein